MTLFIYIIKDYFKYILGTVVLCTFMFVLFDFIHKTTRYLDIHRPETKHLIQYYIYNTPSLITQALPIAALLASVITMVLLSRTNEITAMRAAGMGPLRVGAPIAIGGLILSILSIGLGEYVLPNAAKRMHFVESVLIKKEAESHLADGARWVRRDDVLYNFRDYDPITKIMLNVKVIQTGKSFRPKRSIEAVTGRYRDDTKDWLLSDCKILYFWPNGTLSYTEKRNEYVISIPIEPANLKKERRTATEMSLSELLRIVKQGDSSGVDVLSYKVDMHVKLAFHFAAFVVSLIGLKFGYRSERSIETAKGVLLAIAIGVSYWFILNAGQALGKRGTIHPLIAAWIANIVIFSVSAISIIKTKKA